MLPSLKEISKLIPSFIFVLYDTGILPIEGATVARTFS
jgi:hypothetical protein